MPDPAEDIPADGPVRWGDGDLRLGTAGLGVSGAAGIGAVVELADQLHRAIEGMEVTVAVVADIHHSSTGRTRAVEDVEFPECEIGIRRPVVRHRTAPHALVRFAGSRDTARGYGAKPEDSSYLSGR